MWGVYEFRNQLAIMIATAIEQYGDCVLPEGRRKEYEEMHENALRMLLEFRLPSESFPFVTTMKKKQLVDALEASICIPMCAIAQRWVDMEEDDLEDRPHSDHPYRLDVLYGLTKAGKCLDALYLDLELGDCRGEWGRAKEALRFLHKKAESNANLVSRPQRDISAEDLECAEGTPDSEKPFVIQSHLFTHRMLPEGFNSHTVHRFRDFPNGSMRFYKSQEVE
jgi:hypothetical protein